MMMKERWCSAGCMQGRVGLLRATAAWMEWFDKDFDKDFSAGLVPIIVPSVPSNSESLCLSANGQRDGPSALCA